jgi:hypothetical protein
LTTLQSSSTKKVTKSHDRVAIKIYKIKDHDQETISGRTPLKIYAFKNIVKDENVFLETTEVAKFKEPFKPLFFGYSKHFEGVDRTEKTDKNRNTGARLVSENSISVKRLTEEKKRTGVKCWQERKT